MGTTPTLTFGPRTFDAVIVLNGDIPDIDMFLTVAELPIIAADGAAVQLIDIGVLPEFVVGDLDSITTEALRLLEGTAELVVEPDQNSNDFQKAIVFAQSQMWTRLLVTGIHGGDLEHTLNNWSVFMRYAQSCELTVYERGRYGIPVANSVELVLRDSETVSLIPQPHAVVTTSGLHWALTEEPLTLGLREGARNRATQCNVTVHIHEGALLVFCDSRLPLAPITHAPLPHMPSILHP